MSGVEWTDAEREAVDLALHADDCPDDDCPGGDLGEYRRQAEVALDALAPSVAAREAQAWDDGFDAGHQAARSVNHEWPEMPRNPHRIERRES